MPETLVDVESELEELQELRLEVNLLVYPFFALNHREVGKRKTAEYRAVVERAGEKIEVLWSVSANAQYGYPGPFDKKVHRVIEQIIDGLPLPIRNPIAFSTYELAARLGDYGGKRYRDIRRALERIAATAIKTQGTFYVKGQKQWHGGVFHLYDVFFKGSKLPDGGTAEKNYIFLNDLYLESINSRYVKPIDYAYYESLENAIAQRLYEILGVKFYGHGEICYGYQTLCQLIPLAGKRFLAHAKAQLAPAHEKLIATGFFKAVEWDGWNVTYTPGERALIEIARYKPPREFSDEQLSLIGEVEAKLKVPRDYAERLAKSHTVEELQRYLADAQAGAKRHD